MTHWVPVYVGLGSNLCEPAAQLRRALDELDRLTATQLRLTSSLYSSKPVGVAEQPDFINAVAGLITQLQPLDLLERLQAIERRHGRNRDTEQRWGPRTLDLDILIFGVRFVNQCGLVIPHPRIAEREFVVLPLAEVAPDLEIPGLGLARELARKSDLTRITRL